MCKLATVNGKIKAVNQLSNTAKLLRAYMAASGITDSKAISSELNITLRTVQRLKLDIASATDGVLVEAPQAPRVAFESATSATGGVSDATGGVNGAADKQPAYITTRATKESLSEIVIAKKDSPFIPQDPYDRAVFEKGRLILLNGCREFWLDKFGGDEERLDLALTQAAGYVQPNNRYKPLEAQVGAQLARIAAEKRDKDQRYAAAVKAKTPAASPSQPQTSRAARTAEFRAMLNRTRKTETEAAL